VGTPTFLNGITRRSVEALARIRQLQVVERHIKPEEMADFSEAFLCGTAAEVTPVSVIGPYKFTPGDISRTLLTDPRQSICVAPWKSAWTSPRSARRKSSMARS